MLSPQPTVDVVVATNRTSPFLVEALESLRAQTWPHWRLVVVDDGAPDPDALAAVVARVVDRVPAALVLHRAHGGVSSARNAGLAAGTGELVAFLDDDDVWHPRRLESQVEAMRADPDCVGAFSAGWYLDADGQTFGEGWPAGPTPVRELLSGRVPAPRIVTLLVRRDTCEMVGGFDETLWLAEDNDFVLRVLQHGRLACVPEQLVGYRRHDANTSDTSLTEGRRATDRLLAKQIAAAAGRGDSATAALLREHRRRHHARAADESVSVLAAAVRRRDRAAFLDELGWATRHAPVPTLAATLRRTGHLVRRVARGAGSSPARGG